ncbi:hypothetical protein MKW92_035924 [Papaver armeniacum]|nr:hypothetical protein MKW92_035924 [Papaver armeniacum]
MLLWVFRYGSLVYNFGFYYDEKVVGFMKGHKRVFDLACIDHRGTPEHPARTCTLEAKRRRNLWGVAFCVKGGPEKERLSMEVRLFLKELQICKYGIKLITTKFYLYNDYVSLDLCVVFEREENASTILRRVSTFTAVSSPVFLIMFLNEGF